MIKVCGMTDGENIRQVEALGIDLMGFIFYPKSPRCVRQRPSYLPTSVQRVGVFVNASIEQMQHIASEYALHFIQLHGSEEPDLCQKLRRLGLKVIKAFPVATASDLQQTSKYEDSCDLFLFDTKTPGYGGSGQAFNWNLLHEYHGSIPFLLSGGIGFESLPSLITFSHPRLAGYDLNSRFESAAGIKDVALLQNFLNSKKLYESNQPTIQ